ncbi:MAG: F0F1 ATP synthase subunit I [Moraxellaceae bacterium]|nr:MAG: F0F1 ATP synthase subunit I [Moraxellaceae bacterium]
MTKPRALNDRSLAYRLVGTQAAVASLFPVLLLIISKDVALSALIGGWIATASNAYFAFQAFRYSGARAASQMVKSFQRGESGKFVITIVLMLVAFKYVPALQIKENALAMFTAFIAVLMVSWFAPLLFKQRINK